MGYRGKEPSLTDKVDGLTKIGNSYYHYSQPCSSLLNTQSTKRLKKIRPTLVTLTSRLTKLSRACSKLNLDPSLKKPIASEKRIQYLLRLVASILNSLDRLPLELVQHAKPKLEEAYFSLVSLCKDIACSTFAIALPDPELLRSNLADLKTAVETSETLIWELLEVADKRLLQIEEEKVKAKQAKAVFESPTPGPRMDRFIEGVKTLGWKVQESLKQEPLPEEMGAGFEASSRALAQLQKNKTQLLADKVLVGVIRFPVIFVQGEFLFTERVINVLVNPEFGFDIHRIFGGYLVINNALLIGIDQKITKVVKIRSNPYTSKLDFCFMPSNGSALQTTTKTSPESINYYSALQPYLHKEYASVVQLLNRVKPVNPPLKVRNHFYYLLFPTELTAKCDLLINGWDFLAK